MMRRMLQRRHLSDLLLETQGWTGFLKAFTRVTSGRPITEADTAEQITLLACLERGAKRIPKRWQTAKISSV
jgi:hypothetical protein